MTSFPLINVWPEPFYYELNTDQASYRVSAINEDIQGANGHGCLVNIDKQDELIATYAYQGVYWFYCRGIYRFDELGLSAEQYDGFFKCKFVLKRQGVTILEFKYKPIDPQDDVLIEIADILQTKPRGKLLSELARHVRFGSETDLQKRWEMRNS